jgi:hypothetical protein
LWQLYSSVRSTAHQSRTIGAGDWIRTGIQTIITHHHNHHHHESHQLSHLPERI